MLAVLLLCAFFLPGFSARQNTADDASASLAPVSAQDHGKGTIVLDPGHGGDDPGMTGNSKITEKTLNLIYAKKLAQLFTDAGYRVVLTRETEDGLYDADSSHKKAQDMQRRVAIIAGEEPLLTISIHQNSLPDHPSVHGAQVFYNGAASGPRLGETVQAALNGAVNAGNGKNAKAIDSTIYLMKNVQCPAILVECGFLSNRTETGQLLTGGYQLKLAVCIAAGFLQHDTEGASA